MDKNLETQFVDLFEKNQRIVHKICKIYANDRVEHEDLFQEIAIQLWKAYPNFKGEAKFSTWMYSVSLNTAMSIFRKKNIITTPLKVENHDSKIYNDKNDDEEKIKKMYQAIHKLNDVEKALIMMYLDEKDYNEISKILGITEGNARVKMNRAKNKLKDLIQNV